MPTDIGSIGQQGIEVLGGLVQGGAGRVEPLDEPDGVLDLVAHTGRLAVGDWPGSRGLAQARQRPPDRVGPQGPLFGGRLKPGDGRGEPPLDHREAFIARRQAVGGDQRGAKVLNADGGPEGIEQFVGDRAPGLNQSLENRPTG